MATVQLQAEVLMDYKAKLQDLAYISSSADPEPFLPEEELQVFWQTEHGLSEFFARIRLKLRKEDIAHLQNHSIKLISTLIWINYATWKRIEELCFHNDQLGLKLTDRLLRMTSTDDTVLQNLFYMQDAVDGHMLGEFTKWRWIFVPLSFEEGVQTASLRIGGAVPIIKIDDEISGRGGGGVVRAVYIPASCLKTKGSHKNYVDATACKNPRWQKHPPPHKVACKRIHSAEFSDSGEKEIENLNLLRKSHIDHKNLAQSISAVSIFPRHEIILLFQLGVSDLQQFLLGERGTDLASWGLEDLLEQMYWIGDALLFLHESLCRHIGPGTKPKTFCHRDVKPANILVYAPAEEDEEPAGIWKLTDFGLSDIHEMKQTLKRGRATFSAAAGMPFAGRCCAPEIFDGIEAGRAADVWSLGCVLYQVAVLGMNVDSRAGKTGKLAGFQAVRKMNDLMGMSLDGRSLASSDCFYRKEDGNDAALSGSVNPHVLRWLEENLKSDSTFAVELSSLLKAILTVDPEQRIKTLEYLERMHLVLVGIQKENDEQRRSRFARYGGVKGYDDLMPANLFKRPSVNMPVVPILHPISLRHDTMHVDVFTKTEVSRWWTCRSKQFCWIKEGPLSYLDESIARVVAAATERVKHVVLLSCDLRSLDHSSCSEDDYAMAIIQCLVQRLAPGISPEGSYDEKLEYLFSSLTTELMKRSMKHVVIVIKGLWPFNRMKIHEFFFFEFLVDRLDDILVKCLVTSLLAPSETNIFDTPVVRRQVNSDNGKELYLHPSNFNEAV